MLHRFHFQFFAADGGDTGSTAAIAQPTTQQQSSAPAQAAQADVPVQGQQQGQTAAIAQPQEESFESLIAGRYKADYERRVKAAVNDRLKGTKRTMKAMTPILDVLGQQYGIDVSDVEKIDFDTLARRLTDDKRLYEQEAIDRGIPLETLMHQKQLERQNAALQRENAQVRDEQQRREEFDRITQQFAEVRQLYPGADLGAELGNPEFGRLVANGVPARTAFEVVHMKELDALKARAAAQVATQQTVAGIQAKGLRPQEGAASAGNGAPVAFDPTKLTPKQREEIRERVRRGEKIIL